MDLIYWDHYYDKVLLANLTIVLALFLAMRWFSGMVERMDPTKELLVKDNPAYGISLAGKIFGIAIMLSGTIFGGNDETMSSVWTVFQSGLSGIVFMAIAHFIFTKITLSKVSVRDEIVKGNVAVAVADTGNILAAAIIVRGITQWLSPYSFNEWLVLVVAFIISQVLFTSSTLAKIKLFSLFNKESFLIQELKNGNTAVSLGFAGRKIGTAFAIKLAASLISIESSEMGRILFTWLWVSVLAIIAFEILCYVSAKIILYKVNIKSEIIVQKNVALGALQGTIYLSLGYLLTQF